MRYTDHTPSPMKITQNKSHAEKRFAECSVELKANLSRQALAHFADFLRHQTSEALISEHPERRDQKLQTVRDVPLQPDGLAGAHLEAEREHDLYGH